MVHTGQVSLLLKEYIDISVSPFNMYDILCYAIDYFLQAIMKNFQLASIRKFRVRKIKRTSANLSTFNRPVVSSRTTLELSHWQTIEEPRFGCNQIRAAPSSTRMTTQLNPSTYG